jgi:hypothetical protein
MPNLTGRSSRLYHPPRPRAETPGEYAKIAGVVPLLIFTVLVLPFDLNLSHLVNPTNSPIMVRITVDRQEGDDVLEGNKMVISHEKVSTATNLSLFRSNVSFVPASKTLTTRNDPVHCIWLVGWLVGFY